MFVFVSRHGIDGPVRHGWLLDVHSRQMYLLHLIITHSMVNDDIPACVYVCVCVLIRTDATEPKLGTTYTCINPPDRYCNTIVLTGRLMYLTPPCTALTNA